MLALAEFEARLCPLCGRPLSVCTAESAERDVKVPPPTRCHYSTKVMVAQKAYEKAQHPRALMFFPQAQD